MPRTMLEFFADEAGDYLDKLEHAVTASETPDPDEVRRLARALRGSARMADREEIARAAGAVQSVAEDLCHGRRHWGPELRETLETALALIREMVRSVEAPPPELADRAAALAEQMGQPAPPPPPPPKDDERFRRYLGTELRGLASEIGDALAILERDPRNREPLKTLLRRVRPLRGIEGIDELPAVGSALAAVEEVILRIADTSATVGPGHLVLFRRARQALDDVATDLIRGATPATAETRGPDIEDLKAQVLETAGPSDVAWVSDLFYDDGGPHIEKCPMAEQGAGSWEAFFVLEATGSLDTIDRLRADVAVGGPVSRRSGERLARMFRQLRERAVAFGHPDFGRLARRAGAAVRAALDGPPWRWQSVALDLATTAAALRAYLEASDAGEQRAALQRAEQSLEQATRPTREQVVEIGSLLYSPEDALARARELSSEIGGLLGVPDPDFGRAQLLLEEALDLVEHVLDRAGAAR